MVELSSNIDGKLAQSYKVGTEVVINDNKYKTMIQGSSVVWSPVDADPVTTKEIGDDELDLFKPSRFTFFMIGNERQCKPCASAIEDIKAFIEGTVEEHKWKKWHYDMDTKEVEGTERAAWIRRERKRNEKLRDYQTIPMVWYKGEFIGGAKELAKVLAESPEWND